MKPFFYALLAGCDAEDCFICASPMALTLPCCKKEICKRCARSLYGEFRETGKHCPFCKTPVFYDWSTDKLVLETERQNPRSIAQATNTHDFTSWIGAIRNPTVSVEAFVDWVRNVIPEDVYVSVVALEMIRRCVQLARDIFSFTPLFSVAALNARRENEIELTQQEQEFELAVDSLMQTYDGRTERLSSDHNLQRLQEIHAVLMLFWAELKLLHAKIKNIMHTRTVAECEQVYIMFKTRKAVEYYQLGNGTRANLQRYSRVRAQNKELFISLFQVTNHVPTTQELSDSIYFRSETYIINAPPVAHLPHQLSRRLD
jgi:hypothetical protein